MRKLIMVFYLSLFVLIFSEAVAAANVLTIKQVVEEYIIPIAQHNNVQGKVNDRFSHEELQIILKVADENGIKLSDEWPLILETEKGYSELEVIMDFVRSDFGDYDDGWTIEQHYWFGEVMVSTGLWDENLFCLPGKDEIGLADVMDNAKQIILNNFSDDVSDTSKWKRIVIYSKKSNDDGDIIGPATWRIWFRPNNALYNDYSIEMDSAGMIISTIIHEGISPDSTSTDVILQYQNAYGSHHLWTPEVWVLFNNHLRGLTPLSMRAWAFQNTVYILPIEAGISKKDAEEKAIEAVGLDYTTVYGSVSVMDGEIPIWKVEIHHQLPQDIGTGKYTAIWLVEIDSMTGTVRDKREFIVGGDISPLVRWIPWSVFENLPPFIENQY